MSNIDDLILVVGTIWLVFWCMIGGGVFYPIWRRKNPYTAFLIGILGFLATVWVGAFLLPVPRV